MLTWSPEETSDQWPKSTRSAAHFTRIASFCPFTVAASLHSRLGAFSSWKQGSCWHWASADLRMVLSRTEHEMITWQQAIYITTKGSPTPPRHVHDRLYCHLSQPPNSGVRPATSRAWLIAPSCSDHTHNILYCRLQLAIQSVSYVSGHFFLSNVFFSGSPLKWVEIRFNFLCA